MQTKSCSDLFLTHRLVVLSLHRFQLLFLLIELILSLVEIFHGSLIASFLHSKICLTTNNQQIVEEYFNITDLAFSISLCKMLLH